MFIPITKIAMRSRLIQHPLTHPNTKFPCNRTRSLPKYNNPKQIQIPQLKKKHSNQYPDNIASYMFWHFISWGLGTLREVLFKDW